jgi:hypothetical protein
MGQFDSRLEAAQTQVAADDREAGLAKRIPQWGFDIVEFLLEFCDDKGVVLPLKGAVTWLKHRAGSRSEENVEYLIKSVASDLRDLIVDVRGLNVEVKDQQQKLEEIQRSVEGERFSELLTEAAMQATRTSSRKRIERLASIVVSSAVRFPSESIDMAADFERHCVELADDDIRLLSFVAAHQQEVSRNGYYFDQGQWAQQIRMGWLNLPQTEGGGYIGIPTIKARSSFARLQSRGLVAQLSWGNINAGAAAGADPYAVLEEGRMFLKFLSASLTRQVSQNA